MSKIGTVIHQTMIEETALYDVVEQTVQMGPGEGDTIPIVSILSKSGHYAGPEEILRGHLDQYEISPESHDDSDLCQIGWSVKNQKWFGWSHRSMMGYGIGDMSFDGVKIETIEQARLSAISFAEYSS